jgi:hypothetical protein
LDFEDTGLSPLFSFEDYFDYITLLSYFLEDLAYEFSLFTSFFGK